MKIIKKGTNGKIFLSFVLGIIFSFSVLIPICVKADSIEEGDDGYIISINTDFGGNKIVSWIEKLVIGEGNDRVEISTGGIISPQFCDGEGICQTMSGIENNFLTLSGAISETNNDMITIRDNLLTKINSEKDILLENIDDISGYLNSATGDIESLSGLIENFGKNLSTLSSIVESGDSKLSGDFNTLSGAFHDYSIDNDKKIDDIEFIIDNLNYDVVDVLETMVRVSSYCDYQRAGYLNYSQGEMGGHLDVCMYTGGIYEFVPIVMGAGYSNEN